MVKSKKKSIGENSPIGYVLDVNLEDPDELNELINDYPLAPEKLEISHNILSNYCSDIENKYGIKIGDANKFVPNLSNKSKYVLHYRYLQLYLLLGMKLTKVHRILKFIQSDWLKNTLILIQTKEKMLLIVSKKTLDFKLMNNSVCAKTMEHLRKRINVRLVNNDKD